MKKTSNIFLLSSLIAPLAIGFVSCTNEEEDIFDESSAVRLEMAKKETSEKLAAAPNGWLMYYFPSVPDYDGSYVGGYTFHMKFNANNSVVIKGCNEYTGNVVATDKSAWEMISDNGPVLTFNTFNTVFHPFSEPSWSDGVGFGGDYEFVVMELGDDKMLMRGKKRKIDAPMIALESGVDPDEFLKTLRDKERSFFSQALLPLRLTTGVGEDFDITNLRNGAISFVPVNGDAITETEDWNYMMTANGIRFMSPYTGKNDNFSVQNFTFNADQSISCDDEEATISIGNPIRVLGDVTATWNITLESMTGAMLQAFEEMQAALKEASSKDRNIRAIRWIVTPGEVQLSIRGTYTTNIAYNFTSTINSDGSMKLAFAGYGQNGEVMLERAPGMKSFLDYICSATINCKIDNMISPTECNATIGGESFSLTR